MAFQLNVYGPHGHATRALQGAHRLPLCLGGAAPEQLTVETQAKGAAVDTKTKDTAANAKREAKAAVASAKAGVSSSSIGQWKPGEQLLKREEDSVAVLRKAHSNSLFVVAAILSRDGLQDLCRLVFVFSKGRIPALQS